MIIPFSGSPGRYKNFAIVLSGAIHLWIYAFFLAVKYIGQGENWLDVWQLPAGLAISAMITAVLHFRWMMRLDARYGKGSSWEFKEVTVKLPVLKSR